MSSAFLKALRLKQKHWNDTLVCIAQGSKRFLGENEGYVNVFLESAQLREASVRFFTKLLFPQHTPEIGKGTFLRHAQRGFPVVWLVEAFATRAKLGSAKAAFLVYHCRFSAVFLHRFGLPSTLRENSIAVSGQW